LEATDANQRRTLGSEDVSGHRYNEQIIAEPCSRSLQSSAAAGGVVAALLLWIIMASVMYVVARLSGGQAGFNKSSVLVGFSTIPLSIYSALLLLLSQVAPTLALTQSQGFGLTFPFKAVFVGWSGLLVAWGTSIAYRIGFKRMLVASLMFSLLFFYGPNIA